MAQRISRAKQRIKAAGATFELPPADERAERLRVVLQVLYLMFNEGYTTTSGPTCSAPTSPTRPIRLTRAVHRLLPDDGEVAGLLALMLLTDARRAARTGPDGELIPLAEQDRSRWDRDAIAEGVDLVTAHAGARPGSARTRCRPRSPRCTTRRATADDTDWPQILALYDVLDRVAPNPMVTLNQAVARADGRSGPRPGSSCWRRSTTTTASPDHHRLHAVRAHLLEMAGDTDGGAGRLPRGRPPHRQHARAALPRGTGGPAAGRDASDASVTAALIRSPSPRRREHA